MNPHSQKCKLCGVVLSKEYRINSHVLTRAQYMRPLTSLSSKKILGYQFHDFQRTKFDPSHAITDNAILCKNCDQKLGIYENSRVSFTGKYSDVFSGSDTLRILDSPSGSAIKLACLADLFRCSVTSIPQFIDISLGEKHERLIASLLSNKRPLNYYDYPLILYKMKTPIRFDAVLVPQKRRIRKQIFYSAVMPGGWCWIMKVDSQRNNEFEKLSVDKLAEKVLVIDSGDGEFVELLFDKIIRAVESDF